MDYDVIFQGVQTQVMGAISEIAPVAITVFGALLAISLQRRGDRFTCNQL